MKRAALPDASLAGWAGGPGWSGRLGTLLGAVPRAIAFGGVLIFPPLVGQKKDPAWP